MNHSSVRQYASAAILALMLAIVFALSVMAIVLSEYLTLGRVVQTQESSTITICALAAGLSAILVWLLQEYAANRNLMVRFFYALVMLILVFGAAGGALVIANNYFSYDATKASLFQGFFWESVNGFYSFAVFMITATKPSLIVLFLLASLYIALVGPQRAENEPTLGKLSL